TVEVSIVGVQAGALAQVIVVAQLPAVHFGLGSFLVRSHDRAGADRSADAQGPGIVFVAGEVAAAVEASCAEVVLQTVDTVVASVNFGRAEVIRSSQDGALGNAGGGQVGFN